MANFGFFVLPGDRAISVPFLMRIYYSSSIPDAVRDLVAERIRSVVFMFPPWVRDLRIDYSFDGPGEEIASVVALFEYRSVAITIHPRFFSDDDWVGTLTHEVGHVLTVPLQSFIERVIKHYVPEAGREFVEQEAAFFWEMVAEDFADFVRELSDEIQRQNLVIPKKGRKGKN